jgi:hypothetical protein
VVCVIEAGLVLLVKAAAPGIPGGYDTILPKDQISAANPKAWTYRSIHSTPEYIFQGQTGWVDWTVQIDCHGLTAADKLTVARAIDGALRGGFQGSLSDPDSTYVFGIFGLNTPKGVDGFSDENRSFVCSLEYLVMYQQI